MLPPPAFLTVVRHSTTKQPFFQKPASGWNTPNIKTKVNSPVYCILTLHIQTCIKIAEFTVNHITEVRDKGAPLFSFLTLRKHRCSINLYHIYPKKRCHFLPVSALQGGKGSSSIWVYIQIHWAWEVIHCAQRKSFKERVPTFISSESDAVSANPAFQAALTCKGRLK